MPKAKQLQKVTDFEQLETTYQVKEYLKENPKKADSLLKHLQEMLNETYQKKLGDEGLIVDMICECQRFYGNDEGETWTRNTTYEMNHSLISGHIHNYIVERNGFPTIHHIAEQTGLSRTTVYRHLDDGLKTKYNALTKGKLEIMATSAMEKLYLIGVQDNNAGALKTFIELSGAFTKPPTANINNYIQINNLKISKEEFDKLPEETISQIEKLVSDNLKPTPTIKL